MVQMIKQEKSLAQYLHTDLEDAGICVDVDPRLGENDYAAIKVDDYYNGQHDKAPPMAVDFVVAVDCSCLAYALYILEFKNIHKSKNLSCSDIQEKFATTIYRFMSEEYKHIFLNDRFKYKDIKLYLVSDLYRLAGKYKSYTEYASLMDKMGKRDTLKVDRSLAGRIYRFRNKILRIEFEIPPNPIIKKI